MNNHNSQYNHNHNSNQYNNNQYNQNQFTNNNQSQFTNNSQYNNDHSDDEEEVFMRKVTSLKHIAIDLTDVLKKQNQGLRELRPAMDNTIFGIRKGFGKLMKGNFGRWKGWVYYLWASLFLSFILFIYVVFL